MNTCLPNAEAANVQFGKVTEYLLVEGHTSGGGKAKFLIGFGYSPEEPEILIGALLKHATENPVVGSRRTNFGMVYEIDGPMECPNGTIVTVRTVWIIDHGKEKPRLVTLIPA